MTLATVPPTAALTARLMRLVELHRQADELEAVRAEAEVALLRQARADLDAQRVTRDDLDDLFLATRGHVVHGFDQRWKSELGLPFRGIATRVAHRTRQQGRFVPNGTGGKHWTGAYPIQPLDPAPPPGMPVAYVLFRKGLAVYVGSIGSFLRRVQWHGRDGKGFDRWMAYPCRTREEAFAMEDRLILAHDLPVRRPGRTYREPEEMA